LLADEDLEEMSDCSAEIPSEHGDLDVTTNQNILPLAAANYKPTNYQEEYKLTNMKR